MRLIMNKTLPLMAIVSLVVFPAVTIAQITSAPSGLVPCGKDLNNDGKVTGRAEECEFEDIIGIIQNIINYVILISAPIAAIMFTYAGFLYLTAAGNPGKISSAHGIFWTVFVGFCIVLGAWVIVKTISTLVDPSFSQFLGT